MLIATGTNVLGEVGGVATSLIGDFYPYILFIIGMILGFWVLEKLITFLFPNYEPRFRDDTESWWYDGQRKADNRADNNRIFRDSVSYTEYTKNPDKYNP